MFKTAEETKAHIIERVAANHQISAPSFDVEHVFGAAFSFDDETGCFVQDAGSDDFWLAVLESQALGS